MFLNMKVYMRDCSLHFSDFVVRCLFFIPQDCSLSLLSISKMYTSIDLIVFLHKKRRILIYIFVFVFQALKRAKQCASIALQDENLIETSLEFYSKISQLLVRYVGIRPTE
jgi:hypothetical protein